jgi:spermidine synthase
VELRLPNRQVLIIGAAGGHEIVASLYYGAAHVTAVELNPTTVSLLTDYFADYSGRLAENERVTIINEEGRSFLKRTKSRYDLIWFVAPDTYAAMNAASSGGFVLSESYLYTREAVVDSLAHLEEQGVLCLQTGDIDFKRKPNRAVRYLATARAALKSLGISNFSEHVLVSATPELFTMVTTLLSKQPFSAEQVEKFRVNAGTVKPLGARSTVIHPPNTLQSDAGSQAVEYVIAAPDVDLQLWYEKYPYNVTPVTDDAPFFWHFTSFSRALSSLSDAGDYVFDPEDAKGERVLLVLLIFATLFSAIFLLSPFALVRTEWHRIPYKLRAGIYFASLGLGFMFFEIALIQKFTLFVGYPTYSLTITLFSMLIFSGMGSLMSVHYLRRRNHALLVIIVLLVLLTCAYQFGTPWLVEHWISEPLPLRGVLCGLCLAPLGLCLGAFMPIGLRTIASVSDLADEYVAWSWAVNGFFSVMSSVLATILSMTFGFTLVLWTAVATYAIGTTALLGIPYKYVER